VPATDGPTLAALDAVLDRIRRAESECRRAIGERDEAQQTLRALQSEIDRVFANRQAERQELLAAQQEAERLQQLAMQRMMKCSELERALFGARTEFDELTEWARVRSARITETLQPSESSTGTK
jgi:multidrug resistance efflux pump